MRIKLKYKENEKNISEGDSSASGIKLIREQKQICSIQMEIFLWEL